MEEGVLCTHKMHLLVYTVLYNVHMELITVEGFRKLPLTTCVAI
jgi:hypothetical protein